MTHLSEIWSCIRQFMPRRQWASLQEIYGIVEERLTLDAEDFDPQSPTSDSHSAPFSALLTPFSKSLA